MDYEKKYKEALEKARQLCAYPTTNPFISDLQDLFPELAETEDERIKKDIMHHIEFESSHNIIPHQKAKLWIAWLEKHKYTEDDLDKAYKCADEVQYRRGYEDAKKETEKQGEQNSNYIHITQTIIDYINKNKERFENDIPKLGDVWNVREICTYPNVNNGEPVVEIENNKGGWMRLPLQLMEE